MLLAAVDMTSTGSEDLPPRRAFGPTSRRDATATNRSASVPTSTVPATWLSGSSTRSSSVVGSQRATTSLRPTILPSSSSRHASLTIYRIGLIRIGCSPTFPYTPLQSEELEKYQNDSLD